MNWVAVAVAVLSAAAVAAAVWSWGRRIPRRVVDVCLAGLCVVTCAAAFGLLMDIITLAFNQSVDSWPATANRVLAGYGIALSVAAWSYLCRTQPVCADTGLGFGPRPA